MPGPLELELPPAPHGELVLAQLSDPHLTSLVGVDPRTLRDKRVLGWLSWRRKRRFHHDRAIVDALVADLRSQRVDHVVVTGDLTHIGLPQELDDARRWLEALGDASAVSVIPGNHDRYVADPERYMERSWRAWMLSDDHDEVLRAIRPRAKGQEAVRAASSGDPAHGDVCELAPYPWLRLRGPVALIGLDSAEPAPWLRATGRLGAPQIDRLRALLRATGAAGYLRCVLVHHAPRPSMDRARKRLLDAQQLTAALDDAGAELVLHGHGHRLRVSHHGRGGVVVQAPSASSSSPGGETRAAWLRYVLRRDADGASLTLTARAAGEVLTHQACSLGSVAR